MPATAQVVTCRPDQTLIYEEQPTEMARLGESATTLDDLLVLGAPGRDNDRGAARVFRRLGTKWQEAESLSRPSGTAGDTFAASLDAAGSVVLAGSPNASIGGLSTIGAVDVFEVVGGAITHLSTISHPIPTAVARFGSSIDVVSLPGGDYMAIIGADTDDLIDPMNDPDAGAAYVFMSNASDLSSWTHVATFLPPTGTTDAAFGASVSITPTHAVIGSPRQVVPGSSQAGAAYVYERVGGVWQTTPTVLTSTDPEAGAEFGFAVALDDDVVAVGSPSASDPGGVTTLPGTVEMYRLTSGSWTSEGVLVPAQYGTGEADEGRFGHALDLVDGDLLVGAPSSQSARRGAMHHFTFDGVGWFEVERFTSPLTIESIGGYVGTGGVGQSVALGTSASNGELLAFGGCPNLSIFVGSGIVDAGAFVDERLATTPLVDCDGDGTLDVCQATIGNDCDQDGILDSCEIANGAPDCDGDGVPDDCTLMPAIELVWIIDTSGSRAPEAPLHCELEGRVCSELQALGYHVASSTRAVNDAASAWSCVADGDTILDVYGTDAIPDPAPCCPTFEPNQGEVWTGASAIVSRFHPWGAGSIRVILVISDECGWSEEPGCNADDEAAAAAAAAVLRCDDVYPIMVGGVGISAEARYLMQDVADTALGRWVELDPDADPLDPVGGTATSIVESIVLRAGRSDGNDNGAIDRCGEFELPPDTYVDCNDNGISDAYEILIDLDDGIGSGMPSLDEGGIPGRLDECESGCPTIGDIDGGVGDGLVGFSDLLVLLNAWGPCTGCPEDINGDDIAGFDDLVIILTNWGWCEITSGCHVPLGTVYAAPQSIWDCYARTGGDPDKLAACIEAMLLAGTP